MANNGLAILRERLQWTTNALRHRGPDELGFYILLIFMIKYRLGHCCLKIINLDKVASLYLMKINQWLLSLMEKFITSESYVRT